MTGWVTLSATEFLKTPESAIVDRLAAAQLRRNLPGQAAQLHAWERMLPSLRSALDRDAAAAWTLHLEYPLLRLDKRADAILLTDRAIYVLEFKTGHGGDRRAAARQVDDYALDLRDFHAGSRSHPIVPIVVAAGIAPVRPPPCLPLVGLWPTHHAQPNDLAALFDALQASIGQSGPPLDAIWWNAQPYRPVPDIVEAARMAFARQAVPEINQSRADAGGLRRTTRAVLDHVDAASAKGEHRIVFVTGIPGAGKTRCGLGIAFESDARAVFLTGNPTLVHVFREALARDAIRQGDQAAAARQRMEQRVQSLPAFRDHHVATGDVPDESVIVIDEAQRSWSAEYAIRKTRDRRPSLTDSEPGHILDAMARHGCWATIVCLVGGGQEIHDGEGGLAEWGKALTARPSWRAFAAPIVTDAADARQRLEHEVLAGTDPALHLDVSVRSLQGVAGAEWVDALLRDDFVAARHAAAGGSLPFFLTRDREAMRAALRHLARGNRRAGLLASSGARRLRADGLGVELPHMDRSAVARWYLDRWPEDVRASDALEVVGTEFSCQGLELDFAGLAWGGDLVRRANSWRVRRFVGTDWQNRTPSTEGWINQINTYRVLLTRARYATVIFVPRGAEDDRTRDPPTFDAIAEHLLECGIRRLVAPIEEPLPIPLQPALL